MSWIAIGIAVGAVTLIGGAFLYLDYRAGCRFWLWQRWSLKRRGRRARGVVLSSINRGSVRYVNHNPIHRWDLVVEVALEGETPYRASITQDAFSAMDYTREGASVPLLVDPRDRERVLIDFAGLDQRREDARRRKLDADEKKRDQLLGKKD